MASSDRQRLLITVLTYPHPSTKYQETVCTAAITEDGRWVRLYPVPQRSLPPHQRLRKWQWVEMETLPPSNDVRPESRRPVLDSLVIVDRLDAQRDREERRRLVDLLPHKSLSHWQAGYERDYTSLGVVRPAEVLDLEVTREVGEWSDKEKAGLSQLNLFADAPAKLEKIPYRFRYRFRCEDRAVHSLTIRDWELGVLYLKMRDQYGEQGAVEKVRQKYLDQICAPDKDTRFFVGTMYPYNQWMIIGVFWPPKIKAASESEQATLFDI